MKKNLEPTHECYICKIKKRHIKKYGNRPEGWWTLTRDYDQHNLYFCDKCKKRIEYKIQECVDVYEWYKKSMCIGCNEETGPNPDCPKCGNYCCA